MWDQQLWLFILDNVSVFPKFLEKCETHYMANFQVLQKAEAIFFPNKKKTFSRFFVEIHEDFPKTHWLDWLAEHALFL